MIYLGKSILLVGFPKCGNTWLRFVIFNYLNIVENGASKTITHESLRYIRDNEKRIQHSHLPYSGRRVKGVDKNVQKFYDQFDKIIYIWRNPYDTMISYHEYLKNRDPPFNIILHQFSKEAIKKFETLEGFTKYFLPRYIDHIKSTKHLADLVLYYDTLRKDVRRFFYTIKLVCDTFNLEYNELGCKKAIVMSSFDNIKKMGIETGQQDGLAKGYKGSFCRDGKVGQYKEVMSKELIDYITEKWNVILEPLIV